MDQSDVGPDLAEILLSEEQLTKKLDELAAQIDADYAGKDLLIVGVLNESYRISNIVVSSFDWI